MKMSYTDMINEVRAEHAGLGAHLRHPTFATALNTVSKTETFAPRSSFSPKNVLAVVSPYQTTYSVNGMTTSLLRVSELENKRSATPF